MSEAKSACFPSTNDEKVEWGLLNVTGIFFVIGSMIAGLYVAHKGGLPISATLNIEPLKCVEAIAVINTLFFGVLYFVDLFHQTKLAQFHAAHRLLTLMPFISVSMFSLIVALFALFSAADPFLCIGRYHIAGRTCYIGGVVVSFIVYALCDAVFAKLHKGPRMTRTYWTLFVFGDFPTVAAAIFFYLFLILSPKSNMANDADALLSGALVVQMLFADILVLATLMNIHYWMLKWLVSNCEYADTSSLEPPATTANSQPAATANSQPAAVTN